MKRIGLIDQDMLPDVGKRGYLKPPNIYLLKVAAYHRENGDYVELILQPKNLDDYDLIYVFKEEFDMPILKKVLARENAKPIGRAFKNLERVKLPKIIHESKLFYNIYNPYYRTKVIAGCPINPNSLSTIANTKVIETDYIDIETEKKELEGGLIPTRVAFYGDIFKSQQVTDLFMSYYLLNKRVAVPNTQFIKTEEELQRLLNFLEVRIVKRSKRLQFEDAVIFINPTILKILNTPKNIRILKDAKKICFFSCGIKNFSFPNLTEQKEALIKSIYYRKWFLSIGAATPCYSKFFTDPTIKKIIIKINKRGWSDWYLRTKEDNANYFLRKGGFIDREILPYKDYFKWEGEE